MCVSGSSPAPRGALASLKVDNYAHGEDAAFDSWVLLVRKEDERRQPRTRDGEPLHIGRAGTDTAVITGV